MTAKSNAREGDGVAEAWSTLQQPDATGNEIVAACELIQAAHARELAAALQAQQGAEPVAWPPIESAPKDGTHVWLGAPGNMRVGFWHYPAEGWIDHSLAENGSQRTVHFNPTHWQPLPAALLPATGAQLRELIAQYRTVNGLVDSCDVANELEAALAAPKEAGPIRHSCDLDMLSDCPACSADAWEAIAKDGANPPGDQRQEGAVALATYLLDSAMQVRKGSGGLYVRLTVAEAEQAAAFIQSIATTPRHHEVEPDGYTSYGEFRWACDADERMRAEWTPVWTGPASPPPEAAAAVIEGSRDFVSATEASRIARVVQQLRNDGEDDAADLIELLSSQRREHRAKHKSYKRRFREAQAKLAALASPTGVDEAMVERACEALVGHDLGPRSCAHTAMRAALEAAIKGDSHAG